MMDFEVWKQRHEELMREARQKQLARALGDSRKRRGASHTPSLAWEGRRLAGRLRKRLRPLMETSHERKDVSDE
jgi:hypothetical protein